MRLRLRHLGIAPETKACCNCDYFIQHYLFDGSIVYMGHCVFPRIKPRKAHDYCDYFKKETGGKHGDV